MNSTEGFVQIKAGAIILAMGCRERPRGALNIPGLRPAGIYSAGTAQRLVNMDGFMPGREVVILGSGDIGLIMARRMTLEGAKVNVVAEIMPYSGGLKRNIVQCLDDFNIPLKLSHTVVKIEGKERVEGVVLAKVDENLLPIEGSEEHYSCDTLLLSVGLIPENEISKSTGITISNITNGPVVNDSFETSIPGIFACGNGLHVHDLADFVTKQAGEAALGALRYLKASCDSYCDINAGNLIAYVVPAKLHRENLPKTVTLYFRVRKPLTDVTIEISKGDKVIRSIHKDHMIPSEMEQVIIANSMLEDAEGDIQVQIKES